MKSMDVGQSRRYSRSPLRLGREGSALQLAGYIRDGIVMELFRRREVIGRNSAYTVWGTMEKLHNECRCGASLFTIGTAGFEPATP